MPTLLLVCDERIQRDILDHDIVFHKLKTLHVEGKISTNTGGSLQGAAFMPFTDTCEDPSLVPQSNLGASCPTALARQEHWSFDIEARAGTFLCLPTIPLMIWLLVVTLLFIV